MNTENRSEWYKKAEIWEQMFIDQHGDQLGLIRNPAKVVDRCAPDLYSVKDSQAGDLKLLAQPFYKAEEKFKIPAQHCWTLNVSDIVDYALTRSDKFQIYVWKVFKESERYGVQIEADTAVYFADLYRLKELVGMGKIHKYIRRMNDTNGNAYGSHTIDLRMMHRLV